MFPARAQVTLDFELDSEPIAGCLRHPDGRATTFNGWIQLVSLLQDAATTAGDQTDLSSNGNPALAADALLSEPRLPEEPV
jgi:hypothetical protein